ncbi:MAG: Ig-like domain-containing protein, partial [Opitutaceae bacterium]
MPVGSRKEIAPPATGFSRWNRRGAVGPAGRCPAGQWASRRQAAALNPGASAVNAAAGSTTTITGTASDPDGSVSSVQVFVNGATTGLAGGGIANLSGSNWT